MFLKVKHDQVVLKIFPPLNYMYVLSINMSICPQNRTYHIHERFYLIINSAELGVSPDRKLNQSSFCKNRSL